MLLFRLLFLCFSSLKTLTIMEFCEVLRKHRTIRDFTGQVVSDELLAKVLDTGLQAPTRISASMCGYARRLHVRHRLP